MSEDGLDLLLGELKNGWDHEWLDESREGVLIGLSSVRVVGGLEVSVENDRWSGDTLGGSAGSILNVNKRNLILSGGIWEMSLGVESIGSLSEIGNHEFVVSNGLIESGAISGEGWWARLLDNPGDNSVLGSASSVLLLLSVLEEHKGWETLDGESLGQGLVDGGVNLGDEEWWVSLTQLLGSAGILWSQLLAMATPWSIEFDEKVFVLLQLIIKGVVSKDKDTILGLNG